MRSFLFSNHSYIARKLFNPREGMPPKRHSTRDLLIAPLPLGLADLGRVVTVFTIILTTSLPCQAYIPQFWMILSRTAENHGRGFYQIEQDVIFSHGTQPQVIREIWTIKNAQNMSLEVMGRKELTNKLRLHFIYQNYKKYQVNLSGKLTSTSWGKDWLEPYFHFRYSQKIKPLLLAQKIIPPEALKMPEPLTNIKDIKRKSESFVRLSRVNGFVSYGIHHIRQDSPPGIWIQQDQFHIQQLRLLSQAQVSARKYKKFARRLWFPSRRTVSWGDHSVEIRLVKVIPLQPSPIVRHRLNPEKMNSKKKTQKWLDDEFIKDFYNRFR